MKPTIKIDPVVYRKVMHWVNKSNFEVSGLGMVRVLDDGTIHVVDTMLLPQKNTSTHTEINPEAVNKAMFDLRNVQNAQLKWWWHSHVKMGCFWSNEDMGTIEEIGDAGWVAATVFNQKNECRSACYLAQGQQTPWGNYPLFLDELTTELMVPIQEVPKEWDEEYEKNVTNQTWRGYSGAVEVYNSKTGKFETQKVGEQRAAGPTTGTAATTTGGSTKRPPGMTKREWKRLKKRQRMQLVSEQDWQPDVDVYGYTPGERMIMAREGWDDNDIDLLLEQGFTPNQIMFICEEGWSADEVLETMAYNTSLTPQEVVRELLDGLGKATMSDDGPEIEEIDDDIPVADRRHL